MTSDDNDSLLKSSEISEFKDVIFQMHPDKSLGLDGLNPVFYQRYWELLDNNIFNECMDGLNMATSLLPTTIPIFVLFQIDIVRIA